MIYYSKEIFHFGKPKRSLVFPHCTTHQLRVLAGLHQGAPQGGLGGDHEPVAPGHPRLLLFLGVLLGVGLGVGVEVDRVVLAEVAEAVGQLGPLVLGGVLGGGQH